MGMQQNFWEEMLIMFFVMTVFAAVISAPICFVLCKMDRKPKDGPRCRRCGYDLRATPGDACTECGAALSPLGVWPPGKPSRAPLVIALSFWSWLMCLASVIGANVFSNYNHEIATHVVLTADLANVHTPASAAYQGAWISTAGEAWVWMDKAYQIPAEEATITLYEPGRVVAICTYIPATRELKTSADSALQSVTSQLYGTPTPDPSLSPPDMLIAGLQQHHGFSGDEQAVREELGRLLDFADQLAAGKTLTYSNAIDEVAFRSLADSTGVSSSFGYAQQEQYADAEIEFLPDWLALVVLGFGLAGWLIGVFVLRRLIYRRMAVSGVPSNEPDCPLPA